MQAQGHILIRRKAKDGKDGANGTNGKDGKDGIQGCILRTSEWATGIEYRNDEALTSGTRYLDIAVVTTGAKSFNAYKCLKTHTSSSSIPVTDTTYWQKFNILVPVYTPLIMAQNAILRFMQGNQLIIMKSDNLTVAAGLAGSDYPLWVGSDKAGDAPFKVSIDGKLYSTDAVVSGEVNAETGKVGGFRISGNSLTNEGFNNDANVIFRNDTYSTFAGIGGNVLPASSGLRAVARFENRDSSDQWEQLGANYAMLLYAENGAYNFAFAGTGNGVLNGWIGGIKYSVQTCSSSSTCYILNIAENNRWLVSGAVSGSKVGLPSYTEMKFSLGTSGSFCVEFVVTGKWNSANTVTVYGRNSTVNGMSGTGYPQIYTNDGSTASSKDVGKGDTARFLLIYDGSNYVAQITDYYN